MSNVKRVYVEKKPEFAVAAKGLRHDTTFITLSVFILP